MANVKTGECYWRDDVGQLFLAESFQDENGKVETTQTMVDENATTTTSTQTN